LFRALIGLDLLRLKPHITPLIIGRFMGGLVRSQGCCDGRHRRRSLHKDAGGFFGLIRSSRIINIAPLIVPLMV